MFDADGKPVRLQRPRYRSLTEPQLYLPWAKAKQEYIFKHYTERRDILDPKVRCLPRGVPRVHNYQTYVSLQFLQAPGKVVIFYEWNHDYRVIRLDGSPHPGPEVQLWMGDSRGRWEGNTLVVDVTNFTDKTWLTTAEGSFHSPALHVIERWTPLDADQIYYEYWVDDPNVFEKPWRASQTFTRAWQKDYEQLEYACHEGNKAVDLILAGSANLLKESKKEEK
jgi:hypothetical protein